MLTNNKFIRLPTRLSTIFKNGPLLAVTVTAIAITVAVGFFEFISFEKRAEKLESEYVAAQKELIRNEVIKVTEYIELKRSLIQQKVKQRIKRRVYEAYSIAENIYNKFHTKLPEKEVKNLIFEALRPLRFFDDDGYFFIHSLDGISQLHPLRPDIEGKNRINVQDSNGKYIVREFLNVIKEHGEGFLSYTYRSFKSNNFNKPKIAYVKTFKPYSWYIGTGDYLENVQNLTQQEILAYIEQVRFGKNSYIFVVDYKGVVLMNASQKHLIGKNIWNLKDPNGVMVVQEERKAVENPEGDFIHYVWNKPSTSTPSPKTSFMKGVKDWQWMIGAGLYLDDVKTVIQEQKKVLKYDLAKQVMVVIFLSILISVVIIYAASKISEKFNIELSFFLNFFRNLSVTAKKIDVDSLQFIEFRELANSANKMLDKQIEVETNRSKIEQSLRASEARLNEAQRITHFGSWEYTAETNELIWSDEVYRILELDPEENKPNYELFIDLIHPDDRELVDSAYKYSLKNKTPFYFEHRLKLKSGTIKRVRDHAEASYNDEGEVITSAGTMQDITELREKEELLKRSQKMDALGKLTGGIAHDYNNMLGVILGYSELLLEQKDTTPQNMDYVTQIRDAGERAKALTAKLMAFTRYTPSHLDAININAELLDHQNMLEKTLTARIKLSLDLCDDIWFVELDSGDLNDAVVNMAINASHAIGANGNVTISTKNIHINSSEANTLNLNEGDYVSLSVSDTGSGIDAQTITQIFDPFFTTKGDKGTGLGLSQVYGFVKRSGGNISVESELGTGTEFVLYFPRYNHDNLLTEENKSEQRAVNGNETILVVDDEASLCELARDILTSHGYRVLIASSAKQALLILEVEKIDLLFSDIIMPGINGYQLANEVEKKYPQVIIQLASGFNDAMNLKNDFDISNLKILQKPYTSNELLVQLRSLLDEKFH